MVTYIFPYIWVFPKIMVPPNHPFVHSVFHYFHHPFWGVLPLLLVQHPFGHIWASDSGIYIYISPPKQNQPTPTLDPRYSQLCHHLKSHKVDPQNPPINGASLPETNPPKRAAFPKKRGVSPSPKGIGNSFAIHFLGRCHVSFREGI